MDDVEKARQLLKDGDVVAIPTETVYGLAGDIASDEGLRKIFSVKERPFFDPLIVHVDTIEKAKDLTTGWNEIHEALATKCWPGPLTLVVPKKPSLNPLITAGLTDVGIRCPRHPLTLELLRHFEGLAAPSANKFGKTSPTQSAHVRQEFGDSVFVLEGGSCQVGIESTVASVVKENGRWKLSIYRPGHFTALQLQDILDDLGLPIETSYAESPVAPGQLEHHYMPAIPLLVGGDYQTVLSEAQAKLKRKFATPVELKLGPDPVLAARKFYQDLRDLSPGHDSIVIVLESQHRGENWRALLNRITKAASFR